MKLLKQFESVQILATQLDNGARPSSHSTTIQSRLYSYMGRVLQIHYLKWGYMIRELRFI